MNFLNRFLRLSFVVLLLSISAGCSIKITYHFLDNLIGWQLSQYVSFTQEQKREVQAMLKEFHSWHRRTQLTLYADYLEQLKNTLLNDKITGEYLHQESDNLQDMLDISVEQLLPGLTSIAVSLDDEQIAEIVTNLEKDRKEYQEDYIDDSDEKVQKRRIKDLTRYIGPFFGKFSDEQKQMLVDWEENLVPHERLMIKQQLHWEQDFLSAMDYQDQPEILSQKLLVLMLYRSDNWDQELQDIMDKNQIHTFAMLAKLFNSQSPKQKAKMKRKFDQYITDFRELAEKS